MTSRILTGTSREFENKFLWCSCMRRRTAYEFLRASIVRRWMALSGGLICRCSIRFPDLSYQSKKKITIKNSWIRSSCVGRSDSGTPCGTLAVCVVLCGKSSEGKVFNRTPHHRHTRTYASLAQWVCLESCIIPCQRNTTWSTKHGENLSLILVSDFLVRRHV
jgi:hypothetical protein